jgi:hypothetical protein
LRSNEELKMLRTVVFVLLSVVMVPVFANCTCEATGEPETIVEAKSKNGDVVTMRFLANPIIARKRIAAHLCTREATKITQAKLWMKMPNGHEHGSIPTVLKQVNEHCTIVEKISPIMKGEWQVLVATEAKDSATILFDAKAEAYDEDME